MQPFLLVEHILIIEVHDRDQLVVGDVCGAVGVQVHRRKIVVEGLPDIPLFTVGIAT